MKLMPEKQWKSKIAQLKKQTKKSTKKQLKEAIVSAVQDSIPKKKFGVFLSGGVDSTLLAMLCKQEKADFYCYSVGIKGSPDLEMAKKAAKQLKLKLKVKEYELKETEKLFKETAKLFKKPDVLNVGVGSVVVAAAKLAKKDKVKVVFGGLGSEEIFCGYQRHEEAKDKDAECWKGLNDMWQRDLVRDFAIMNALNIEVKTPFLDDNVIKKAMGISSKRKINSKQKKIILREIAEELGLPKEFSWRDKKVAQYGSKFDWALDKLAKQKGMRKSDFVKLL